MKASELRADLYRVLETGIPVVIERNGRRLRIVAEPAGSRLDRLVPHPEALTGDPDDLVHLDWSSEWTP
jgi:hypothetical protein